MQLNQLQSEILLSVKELKAEQQLHLLRFIGELRQDDQKTKEQLRTKALREIQQALQKPAFV